MMKSNKKSGNPQNYKDVSQVIDRQVGNTASLASLLYSKMYAVTD